MPSLEEDILNFAQSLTGSAQVAWVGETHLRFRWGPGSGEPQNATFSISSIADGVYDFMQGNSWNEREVLYILREIRPQIQQLVAGRRSVVSQTQILGPIQTNTNSQPARTPERAPASALRQTAARNDSAVPKTQTQTKLAPKRQGGLPRVFLTLDLPSPQEAMPTTPFAARANPDTYKSIQYRTKPKSRASFCSGKTPWTIPSLEIF